MVVLANPGVPHWGLRIRTTPCHPIASPKPHGPPGEPGDAAPGAGCAAYGTYSGPHVGYCRFSAQGGKVRGVLSPQERVYTLAMTQEHIRLAGRDPTR
jgi:hypothetical protein